MAEGAACAKALSGNQLFFLGELNKGLCTVGTECWPRISLSNHPVQVPSSQTRMIRMLRSTCIDYSLLIPNPVLFPPSHATLPFLATWLEYLIFSFCTTGSKSKRFIYFGFEKNWSWNCLWMCTKAKTLASRWREERWGPDEPSVVASHKDTLPEHKVRTNSAAHRNWKWNESVR